MELWHGSSDGINVDGWMRTHGTLWATDRPEIAKAYANNGEVISIMLADDANVVTVTEADELLGHVGLTTDMIGDPSILIEWAAELRHLGIDVVHVTADYEDCPGGDADLIHESWLIVNPDVEL